MEWPGSPVALPASFTVLMGEVASGSHNQASGPGGVPKPAPLSTQQSVDGPALRSKGCCVPGGSRAEGWWPWQLRAKPLTRGKLPHPPGEDPWGPKWKACQAPAPGWLSPALTLPPAGGVPFWAGQVGWQPRAWEGQEDFKRQADSCSDFSPDSLCWYPGVPACHPPPSKTCREPGFCCRCCCWA